MEINKYNYSIIVPHYNIPNLLSRCLSSIPERDDIQVVVVDDMSPGAKSYKKSIKELSRKNVELYIVDKKLGAGHARNIGIRKSLGKWLIFADSDDFFVENVVSIWDKYLNSDAEIIYFNIKSCYSDDTSRMYIDTKDILFDKYTTNHDDRIFRLGYTEPWGKMIRRSLVLDKQITFQETLAHNDFLFSVKTGMMAIKVEPVNEQVYWYVFRPGSLGNHIGKEPISKVEDRVKAFNAVDRFIKGYHIKTREYLPAIPCRRVFFRDPHTFIKMFPFLKEEGVCIGKLLFDISCYIYRRLTKKKSLEIYDQFVLNK